MGLTPAPVPGCVWPALPGDSSHVSSSSTGLPNCTLAFLHSSVNRLPEWPEPARLAHGRSAGAALSALRPSDWANLSKSGPCCLGARRCRPASCACPNMRKAHTARTTYMIPLFPCIGSSSCLVLLLTRFSRPFRFVYDWLTHSPSGLENAFQFLSTHRKEQSCAGLARRKLHAEQAAAGCAIASAYRFRSEGVSPAHARD